MNLHPTVERRLVFFFCAFCLSANPLTSQAAPTPEPGTRNQERGTGAKRPNIVFILADDLGYGDLGCYQRAALSGAKGDARGGAPDIATPHLDQLAADGIRFTDYYANAPICSPTRAAFLTARYQSRIPLDDALVYQETSGRGLPHDGFTIADALKDAGYATALSGKWHLGYEPAQHPNEQGFDHFFGLLGGNHHYFEHMDRIGVHDLFLNKDPVHHEGQYSTDLITDNATRFLREHFDPADTAKPQALTGGPKDRKTDRPFFLYLSYGAPHFPWQGPGDRDRIVEPKKKSWQEGDRATYVAMVESMDAGIGRVLAEIDRLGIRDNTLVVFSSDNGGHTWSRNAPLRDYKGTLFEGGIRVPCIARLPGTIPPASETTQPALTFDWSTTILRLAGATNFPGGEDGIDLLPLLKKKTDPIERTFFWRRVKGPIRKSADEHWAVREGDWKFIRFASGDRFLFDLSEDPGEARNILEDHPERADHLSAAIDAWEKEILK